MDRATETKHLTAALEFHKTGRLDEAERIYRKVLAEQPSNVDALHLLGVLLSARGNPQEGLPMLQKAAALMPQFVENLRDLAFVLGQVGRNQESLACYLRAVQMKPNDAALRADMGAALFAL